MKPLKKLLFILIILILGFSNTVYSQESGIKIAVATFNNSSGLKEYDYLSSSLQNSIYTFLSQQEGIEVIPNSKSNQTAQEINLNIDDIDKLSIMMRFSANAGANVIILGKYDIKTDENTILINVYVYSIAQRKVIIEVEESSNLNDVYELVDKIAYNTSNEVKENSDAIEIAIEEVVSNTKAPTYTDEPYISSVSINGIYIKWTTDKETASKLLLLNSPDRKDVNKVYPDNSADAIHHSIIIPMEDLSRHKDYYFTTTEVDFIGNKQDSDIYIIEYDFIYEKLDENFMQILTEYYSEVQQLKKNEKYEEAINKLETLLNDDIAKYEAYIDLSEDKENIKDKIQSLKNNIAERDAPEEEEKPILYNETESKAFENDLIIQVKSSIPQIYEYSLYFGIFNGSAAITNLLAGSIMVFGYGAGEGIGFPGNIPFHSPLYSGALYTFGTLYFVWNYNNNAANLSRLSTGIMSGELSLSEYYDELKLYYDRYTIVNRLNWMANMAIGTFNIIMGSMLNYTNGGIYYYNLTSGFLTIYYGVFMFIDDFYVRDLISPTNIEVDTLNLLYRKTYEEMRNINDLYWISTVNNIIANPAVGIFGIIPRIFIGINMGGTLNDIKQGKKEFSEQVYNDLRGQYDAIRIINTIEAYIDLGLGLAATFAGIIDENFVPTVIGAYVSGLGMYYLATMPNALPKKVYYPDEICGENIDKTEETYQSLFKRNLYAEANMFYDSLNHGTNLILHTSIGSTLSFAFLMFLTNGTEYGKLSDALVYAIPYATNLVSAYFYYNNKSSLNSVISDMKTGDINFEQAYNELQSIENTIWIINRINGITLLTSSALTVIYSLTSYSEEMPISCFLLGTSFFIPMGIYSLMIDSKRNLPDPEHYNYNLEEASSLEINLYPYPWIDEEGNFGYGTSISISW